MVEGGGGETGLQLVMESEGLPLHVCVRTCVCVPLDLFGLNIDSAVWGENIISTT